MRFSNFPARKFHRTPPPSLFPLPPPPSPFPSRTYARKLNPPNPPSPRLLFYITVSIIFLLILLLSHPPVFPHVPTIFSRSYPLTLPFEHPGRFHHIPASLSRFSVIWHQPPPVLPLSPASSSHRYLYSPVRVATSDGIGHSMGVVNRDLNLALRLNLTYTHRVGTYSSLTKSDPNAVENFFGWGRNEISRERIQKEGCIPEGGQWPNSSDIYKCHICNAPKKDGELKIREMINIPRHVSRDCLGEGGCGKRANEFLDAYGRAYTVFQTEKESCSPPATDSNFLETRRWFYYKYWQTNGRLGWQRGGNEMKLRFKEKELNIAVHVRRGDFLDKDTKEKRGITKDETFAKVIVSAIAVIDDVGGVFSNMQIVVHVYSEGKLNKKTADSVHEVDQQDHFYYDHTGTKRDAVWWKRLIVKTKPNRRLRRPRALKKRLTVALHVSEDTMSSLHEMVAADVFVGSRSGLSNALVWSLSRGVQLIPNAGTIDNEIGKLGYLCCTVPFDNDRGKFLRALFKRYWRAYVMANADSAARALRS